MACIPPTASVWRRPTALVSTVLLALLICGPARVSRAQTEQTLSPASVIHVMVAGEADETGDFTVDPRGDISMLYVNRVHVAGLTVPQAQARVTRALKRYFVNPQVVVTLVSGGVYRITGAVRNPAEYPMTVPNLTLADAIGRAGGIADRAHLKETTIVRRGPAGRTQVLKFDASDPKVQGGTLIERGDDITIPQGRPGFSPDPLQAAGVLLGLYGLFHR